jgi:hypothetical protein
MEWTEATILSEVTDHMGKRRQRSCEKSSGNEGDELGVGRSDASAAEPELQTQAVNVTPATSAELSNDAMAKAASGISEATYLKERSTLIEIEQKSADQHDKAILTVAAGGFAISITFLKEIAPTPTPSTMWLLGTAWGCFVASMLIILLSFQTSQTACRRQRDLLDSLYSDPQSEKPTNLTFWATVTIWLNVASYVLLFLAVCFLAVFSWMNL